jgi:hypothetical protein
LVKTTLTGQARSSSRAFPGCARIPAVFHFAEITVLRIIGIHQRIADRLVEHIDHFVSASAQTQGDPQAEDRGSRYSEDSVHGGLFRFVIYFSKSDY